MSENSKATLGQGVASANRESRYSNTSNIPDSAEILNALTTLFEPGTVVELRAVDYEETPPRGKRHFPGTLSGYFDDFQALAREAVQATPKAKGVYITLNTIDPSLLARRCNRTVIVKEGETTPDTKILCRRWLPIDFDPVRDVHISTTEAERELAHARAMACHGYLHQCGWPQPLVADSGNGYHLLYRIDLPNDEASKSLVENCLKALDLIYGDDEVKIDKSVFNAARIWKLYGTLAGKGDNVPERPHRKAHILSTPETFQVVPKNKLETLAALIPSPEEKPTQPRYTGHSTFDVEAFMAKYDIRGKKAAWGSTGEKWRLDVCPFNPDHTDKSAVVVRFDDGRLGFKCHHNSCSGRRWGDVRDLFEPDRQWQQDNGQTQARSQDTQQRQHTRADEQRSLRVTQLSSVVPERVEFWWKPYIPKGRPVAVEGDPGIGKSTLVSKIVAHFTSGTPFPTVLEGHPPAQPFEPCNVCLLTSEDDPADTIVPRLEVNHGDPSRVYLIHGWQQPDGKQGIVTMKDIALLRQVLETYKPALIVFDPLQSFFGMHVDMNKANDTRPVLDAVSALCKTYNCTPLYVRHIGKSRKDKALYAGLGSIDIAANMRSVLFLGQDPEHPARRILAHSKSNNAAVGTSLAYTVETIEQPILTPMGDEVVIEAPRIRWDGLSKLTANDLAAPVEQDEEEKSALDQAKDFLTELLAAGPMLSDDVQKAVKQAGIAPMTLRRAKPLVGARVRRRPEEGKNARDWPWEWYLPHESSSGPSPMVHTNEHLEHLEDVIEKKGFNPGASRCSDAHLEASREPQEKQQVALDVLDVHRERPGVNSAVLQAIACPQCEDPEVITAGGGPFGWVTCRGCYHQWIQKESA